jgi:transposase
MKRRIFVEGRSRKETALELGVSTKTVQNVLDKLPEAKALFAERHRIPPATLKERRSQWSAAVKQHPDLSRNKIRKIAGNVVYDTLRRNDRKCWNHIHRCANHVAAQTHAE